MAILPVSKEGVRVSTVPLVPDLPEFYYHLTGLRCIRGKVDIAIHFPRLYLREVPKRISISR